MFSHLHVHSYYTYGKGSSSIESLVARAKECGYDAMAITDLNTMAGVVEFYSMCKEYGLFPLIGCEIDNPKNIDHKLTIICRNISGYSQLCELVSNRHLNVGFDPVDELKQHSEGLFIMTYSLDVLRRLKGHVNDLYGELILLPSLKKRNREIYEYASKNNIPSVITNDVYFDTPEKHETHRILASIKQLTTVYDLKDEVCEEQYLKSPAEMKKVAGALKEPMANVQKIVNACQFEFELKKYHCARYRTDDGKVVDSSPGMLRQLSHEGLRKRYAITDKSKPFNYDALIRRLNYELEVISNLNFCDYFLICWDMVTYAHSQGYWHVGRGSAANSLVSYCLGLTEVDPIRYNLYFERFLNYSRGKPPDIDLDFNWRFRDRMLEYIYRRYGEERVAMMSSIHTMHARGALREVAKAYGISERELDTFRKFIPHTTATNLEELSTKYPEAKNLKLNSDLYQKILKKAAQLDGFPHYSGIHSSGVVITEKPVTQYSALERSANGFVKTQLDMYSGEDVGLIKFDVLAVRGLGTIEDAVKNIEKEQNQSIDIFNWGKIFADEKAKELMSTGKTIGVVHAESPFIRNAMRITQATTFELLYVILGMVRTGCVESGMMYMFIERLLHAEKRKEALPALMEVLPETFGVMIFEEDVIKVLHFVGNLTLEEADIVRRYMNGKRVSAKTIQELKAKFFKYSFQKIGDIKEIETLWTQIGSFSGFSFCKAHSASYALMAFQGLYLKIHYPAYYMAAVLSNEGGFYSASAYISECRRLGLTILPPDINLSDIEYKASGKSIRVGLRFIANIGSAALAKVIIARNEKPFDSLQDFVLRSGVGHEEIVTLIKIGCFDSLNPRRTLLIALLDAIMHIQKSRLTQEMFGLDLTHYELMLSYLDDMTFEEKLSNETNLLNYFVAQHPLEFFPKQVNSPSVVKAKDLSKYKNKKVKMIGWLVSAKRIRTRDRQDERGNIQEGQYMKFMTLEDLTGIYDTVLFPKVYARVAEQTLSYGPFCIEGVVDERYNTVNVSRIALVRNKLPQMEPDASLTIEKQEVYAKQKSDNYAYADEYVALIEFEAIERQIIKAS